jgi:hypothetical protein
MRTSGDTLINESALATNKHADIVLDFLPKLAIQASYAVNALAYKEFDPGNVDIVTDKITISNHGYTTGVKGQFSTTGTLPGGIALSTDYWIIKVDNDTIRIALSLANAEAGSAEILNSNGTGTHTFTPATFSGATLKLQSSIDGQNFIDLPSCQVAITSAGTSMFNVVEPAYRYLRFAYVPGSGSMSLNVVLSGHDSAGDTNAN